MESSRAKIRGMFRVVCRSRFTDELKWEEIFPNGVVNVGLDDLLDTYFNQLAQHANFYMGGIEGPGPVLAGTDTMGAHAGWTEWGSGGGADDYDEVTRPEWNPGNAAGQQVTNVAPIIFTANATQVVSGIFITTDNVKGGVAGILWATGLFAQGDKNVAAGDVLEVTYTVTAADA
jgi:hypothetical protein